MAHKAHGLFITIVTDGIYKLHKWCGHGWDGRFTASANIDIIGPANWKQDAWVYLLMEVLNVADEDGKRMVKM